MVQGDPQLALLARLVNVTRLRTEVIAHNVANVNTPGQQCLQVQFEDALSRALDRGGPATAAQLTPQVVEGGGGLVRVDGNNVDIDLEMGRLQKNSLFAELYSQLMSVRMAQYRSAIQGR